MTRALAGVAALALVAVAACGSAPQGSDGSASVPPPDASVDRAPSDAAAGDAPRDAAHDPAADSLPADVGAGADAGGGDGPADAGADVLVDAGPRTTTIRVHYPSAQPITIRGSGGPLDWNRGLPLDPAPDDTWVYETTAITQPLEWKPLLDDTTWSRGPNYKVAPGQTVDVFPHFLTVTGQVVTLADSFQSQYLTDARPIYAYLPPTYDENPTARFPTVYMHDGQNLFDPALAFGGNEWRVDETMNAAAEDGSIAEAIVVGVGNTPLRIYEMTPTYDMTEMAGGGGDAYLRMIAVEIKPMVDGMLRTRPEREHTVLAGSSLGGLISAYGGVTRTDTFGLVGAFSPSTWWDNRVIITDVAGTASAMLRPLKVYVDSGDSGPSNDDVLDTADLAAAYRAVGYRDGVDLFYVVQQGAVHNEVYWAMRLPGALEFLLGPGR